MDPKLSQFLSEFKLIADSCIGKSLPDARVVSNQFFSKGRGFEPVKEVYSLVHQNIPLKILVPEGEGPFPIVLFLHGGGWVFGSIATCEPLCRKICRDASVMVVIVDYPLAPENPYPKALNACVEIVSWIKQQGAQFSGNPNQLYLMGESAGANLAAALSLYFRDHKGPKITSQILLYPALKKEIDKKAFKDCPDQIFLTLEAMELYWRLYLRGYEGEITPYIAPLVEQDLSHLPPAYIVTAGWDPLKAESEEYARRMKDAGNKVVLKNYSDTIHGFLNLPIDLPQSAMAVQDLVKYLAIGVRPA